MESPPPRHLRDAVTRWDGLFWSRPAGLCVGIVGVAAIVLLVALAERLQFTTLSPSLLFMPVIAVLAYGWGGRVGAGTAAVAFMITSFVYLSPRFTLELAVPSEWTRLALIAISYAALVLLGDAARRLRRANQRLETIIASIADGILVVDRRGDLIQTNEALRQMVGDDIPRTLDERNARWQTRAVTGTPMAPDSGPTTRALRGIVSARIELLIRNAAGRDLTVSVSGAPLRGRGGEILGAVIVCRDITEIRRLQQAKDDFLSVASHELKTPLTALGGYAQLLRQRLARIDVDDEKALRYLLALETQTRRMAELVNTLLDVSRLDAGRLQLRQVSCDLVAIVGETVGQIGDLSEQHQIAVDAPAQLLGRWDADRVEQVVVNLLTNAIRYSPAGGPIAITIGTTERPLADAPATAAAPTAAFVRVQDQGLGIPPDQLDAIFDRFHRTQAASLAVADSRRGMGLGLYISREIVERHGGQIWATSPGPGHGATFTFTLPLSASPDPAGNAAPSEKGGASAIASQ